MLFYIKNLLEANQSAEFVRRNSYQIPQIIVANRTLFKKFFIDNTFYKHYNLYRMYCNVY